MLLKKVIKYLITTLMVILSINLSSCGKSGLKNKNNYFDNVGQVDQISIQSIRDKSFKFLL